jgi:hypothetical protein
MAMNRGHDRDDDDEVGGHRPGHPHPTGKLAVHLEHEPGATATLFLTSQGPRGATQHHQFRGSSVQVDLAPGAYLGTVTALGYLPASFTARVGAGETARYDVSLAKGTNPVASFDQRVKAYGFAAADVYPKIELKQGEHRVATAGREGTRVQHVKSLVQLRQFLGTPPNHFSHDTPRFEPVKIPAGLAGRLRERKPTEEDQVAARGIINEYLNGNEKSYSKALDELSPALAALVNSNVVITIAKTLHIGPGATYSFTGSLILDKLEISTTGKLEPTGLFKVDVTDWVTF